MTSRIYLICFLLCVAEICSISRTGCEGLKVGLFNLRSGYKEPKTETTCKESTNHSPTVHPSTLHLSTVRAPTDQGAQHIIIIIQLLAVFIVIICAILVFFNKI